MDENIEVVQLSPLLLTEIWSTLVVPSDYKD